MAILMLQSTQVQGKAPVLLCLSPGQVHDIMHRAVSRGLFRRDTGEEITHLSLDEKSFRQGHRYVSVLGDPNGKRVLDIIEKRTQEVAEKLLRESLTPSQRTKVKSVSMDMWPAFMQAVNAKLPSADIVSNWYEAALLLKNRHLTKVAQMLNRRIDGLLAYVGIKLRTHPPRG